VSELRVPLDDGSETEGGLISAASDACVPPREPQSVSLLKCIFTFPAMLGTVLVATIFYEGRGFLVDPDVWWHVKIGQNILDTRNWPTVDPYSFTVKDTPWIAYEWLGDVLLGVVARFAGLQGLDALLIILGSAIMIALYCYGTLRSGNSKAGFAASSLLCSLALLSFTLRPQMLGYLFIILTLVVLERFRQNKPRALWFLPPLFLIWINTHGSFIIGLGVIFVYWAAGLKAFRFGEIEARRWNPAERLRLEFVFLLCLAVLPMTPYGTRLAVYPLDMAFAQPINVANVIEWQPMPFDIPAGKLFLALVVGFFAAQMLLRPIWNLAELALFFFGTIMACLHARFLMLFVPFFAPLFATMLARWLPSYDRKKEHYVLNACVMTGIVAAMAWYFPTRARIEEIVASHFPVRAVDYVRSHAISGPMYNTYGYGGYLIWALPEHKVFIDGRGDLYERGGTFSDYSKVARLETGAFAVLQSYGIRSCLLQRSEPLATALGNDPGWHKEYSDNRSVLFVRRNIGITVSHTMRESATIGPKEWQRVRQ
jgi:hypothetical protein